MKLSNKILIGFFGFIFIYMTAAFTEIRFRGTSNIIDFSKSIAETLDISGVTHLVVEGLEQSVTIVGSDTARLEIHSSSGNLLQKLKYNVSGDTLILKQLDVEKDPRVRISVYMPKDSLKGLMISNARVDIKNLEQKVLSVSQIHGTISMYDKSKVGTLNLEASNEAYFNLVDTFLDTLSVQLENSEVIIDSPASVLEGSMKNSSYLQIIGPDEIRFKKDESSRLQFN